MIVILIALGALPVEETSKTGKNNIIIHSNSPAVSAL